MLPANQLSYFQNYCAMGRFRKQTKKSFIVGSKVQENPLKTLLLKFLKNVLKVCISIISSPNSLLKNLFTESFKILYQHQPAV